MEKSEEEYIETIKKAGIIAESPVEGTIILKPYGCMIWEQIKKIIKAKLKELGYEDMYFPMLIPHSFFKKQEEHYKSFSREAVFCTRTGEKELKEEEGVAKTKETTEGEEEEEGQGQGQLETAAGELGLDEEQDDNSGAQASADDERVADVTTDEQQQEEQHQMPKQPREGLGYLSTCTMQESMTRLRAESPLLVQGRK